MAEVSFRNKAKAKPTAAGAKVPTISPLQVFCGEIFGASFGPPINRPPA